MGDERPVPGPVTTPRQAPVSQTRSHAHVYRPGLALAAALLLSPALLALLAAGIALLAFRAVPLEIPALLLLILPVIPSVWAACASVRITATSIATARLLSPWREIPWVLIEHARHRGSRVVLVSSSGQHIAFTPLFLRDGTRLYRELLVRLPAHVLDARMATASRRLLGERVVATEEGGLTGSVSARPRIRWRVAALATACIGAALVIPSAAWVRTPNALALGLCGIAGLSLGLWLWRWCSQQLDFSQDGIQIRLPLAQSSRRMTWKEIELIEHTPAERVLRLRGDRRLVCVGPAMLPPAERDLLRAFLHTYCISRGVPVAQRHWLL